MPLGPPCPSRQDQERPTDHCCLQPQESRRLERAELWAFKGRLNPLDLQLRIKSERQGEGAHCIPRLMTYGDRTPTWFLDYQLPPLLFKENGAILTQSSSLTLSGRTSSHPSLIFSPPWQVSSCPRHRGDLLFFSTFIEHSERRNKSIKKNPKHSMYPQVSCKNHTSFHIFSYLRVDMYMSTYMHTHMYIHLSTHTYTYVHGAVKRMWDHEFGVCL